MSLTLTAAPEIIDGARSYAARRGMTLEASFADVCLTYPMTATAHRIAQNRAKTPRGAYRARRVALRFLVTKPKTDLQPAPEGNIRKENQE